MFIMKTFRYILAAIAVLSIVACDKDDDQVKNHETYVIIPVEGQPFLGETYVEDYDFDKGNQALLEVYNQPYTGACSAIRQGDFHARNLDWYLMDYGLLVVHVPAKEGRFASVGILSSTPVINRSIIASGIVPNESKVSTGGTIHDLHDILPVFTTDGINEKGVSINVNIVLKEDGYREGYKPCSGNGGTPISFHVIPRFVLDNCSSVDDAIAKLSKLSVVEDKSGALALEDCHYMISDPNKTAVVEWYNNELVATTYAREDGFYSKNGLPCIMTNFYNCQWEQHSANGVTDWDGLFLTHPFAMGTERAQILMKGFDNIKTLGQMQNHIEQVQYSKYYDPESLWYTEDAGYYYPYDGAWYHVYSDNPFPDAKTAMIDFYNTTMPRIIADYGSLDKQMKLLDSGVESENWYSELTVVYDTARKEFWLMPQEGWYSHTYYRFTL